MRIEDITAEIRPRTVEESVDLGLALTRTNFARIAGLWAQLVLPLCVLVLLLCYRVPLLGLAILIWIKPLFGRLPLLVLSRELFGAREKLSQLRREAWKAMFSNVVGDLVLRRISSSRHLFLPVSQLEGLKGRAARERRRMLAMHTGGSASAVTFQTETFVLVVTFGLMFFVLGVLPDTANLDWETALDQLFGAGEWQLPLSLQWTLVGAYLLAFSLIEPFYIGAGFGLYLNARTLTEGWDIELAFKRIARRVASAGRRGAASLVLLLTAFLAIGTARATAEDSTSREADPAVVGKAEAKQRAEEIMSRPEFEVRTETISRYENDLDEGAGASTGLDLSLFGPVIQLFFWLLVIAVAALLVWQVAKWISNRAGPSGIGRSRRREVTRVMGMSVAPESLPEEIGKAAWKLWSDGQRNEAIALLYRGAISWLIHEAQLEIRGSDTEGDCLRRVGDLRAVEARDQFARLTRLRVDAAYGDRFPADAEMRGLCDNWLFSNAGKEAGK